MSIANLDKVAILGLSASVPPGEIDNREFVREMFGENSLNVVDSTGIAKRRVVGEGVTALDLCVDAARTLIERLAIEKSEIGGLIFVTATPDHLLPNNASQCQEILELPRKLAAFDVNLACSGYPYGLWLSGMMAKSFHKKVLLLDGQSHSQYVSPEDHATSLLFGDAGSATIIGESPKSDPWYFLFETDGSKKGVLTIPEGGYRNRVSKNSLEYQILEDGGKRRGIDLYMNGLEVFAFASTSVPKLLAELLRETSTEPSDLDYLVLHQANLYMMKRIAKRLKIGMEKVPVSLDRFGNTSSTSIPLTIASELQNEVTGKSIRIAMEGFGAGLSTGAGIIQVGPCVCPGVKVYGT